LIFTFGATLWRNFGVNTGRAAGEACSTTWNLIKAETRLFKDLVRTAKKTLHFTITKINWLTLFKEIIAVCTENHMKHTITLCGQNAELLTVEVGVSYSYHWALKD
jgi:hypothetical protein